MFIILSISLSVSIVLTPYLQYTLIHKGIDTYPKPDALSVTLHRECSVFALPSISMPRHTMNSKRLPTR